MFTPAKQEPSSGVLLVKYSFQRSNQHYCEPPHLDYLGLRGIGDEELDSIFRQAEGPNLARIFLLSCFNIYDASLPTPSSGVGGIQSSSTSTSVYLATIESSTSKRATSNARNLASELIQRSVNPNSSIDFVRSSLESYAKESIHDFGVPPEDFKDSIDAVVSAVIESYDDILRYFVIDLLNEDSTA